jgi:hypothetical protein
MSPVKPAWGSRMREPNSDVYARIKATEADLARFERQSATILAFSLALCAAIYGIVLQALP